MRIGGSIKTDTNWTMKQIVSSFENFYKDKIINSIKSIDEAALFKLQAK